MNMNEMEQKCEALLKDYMNSFHSLSLESRLIHKKKEASIFTFNLSVLIENFHHEDFFSPTAFTIENSHGTFINVTRVW